MVGGWIKASPRETSSISLKGRFIYREIQFLKIDMNANQKLKCLSVDISQAVGRGFYWVLHEPSLVPDLRWVVGSWKSEKVKKAENVVIWSSIVKEMDKLAFSLLCLRL